MTYFGFLLRFLVIPIALFAGLDVWLSRARPTIRPASKLPILLMVFIAVLYTTPWDNYLVATGVWWYDPSLVTGVVIGWVPIEEYTFFVLQPILVGLWLVLWTRVFALIPHSPFSKIKGDLRRLSVTISGVVWLISVGILAIGWQSGVYLGLELVWALPPVMLQLAFGADILWRPWKLALMGIVVPTVYLSVMDAFAIGWGTWTIDPAQSTGIMIAEILPIEEFVFFLLTNVLVTMGLVLLWAPESQARFIRYRNLFQKRINRKNGAPPSGISFTGEEHASLDFTQQSGER